MGSLNLSHEKVPRDVVENTRFRKLLLKEAERSAAVRKELRSACAEDILFFLNFACTLHEPRAILDEKGKRRPQVFPLITWPHQEPVIQELREKLGQEDFVIRKSRAEGASWIGCLLMLHDFLFRKDVEIGMCSATEDKADKPGSRGSLMGKILWELEECLPVWMAGVRDQDWKRSISDHTLLMKRSKTILKAFSATQGTGRGDRFTWFFLDELSEWDRGKDAMVMDSLQHATNSRLVVATPQGSDGEYHRICTETCGYLLRELYWWQNKTKNRGLYRMEDGRPVAVDPVGNPLPLDYQEFSPVVKTLLGRLKQRGFDFSSGKARSPWYDRECERSRGPQSIASELDGDFAGSEFHIFGSEFFAAADVFTSPETSRGIFSFNPESLEGRFESTVDGPVRLWMELDAKGNPPVRPYVGGADIATGHAESYKSNSVLTVFDQVTNQQVLEYTASHLEPHDFADECVAIMKWLHNGFLSWEVNGPGKPFTTRVLSRGYGNCYRREVLWRRGRKKTKELGWHTNKDSKETMLGDLSSGVRNREIVIKSRDCIREANQYVRDGSKIKYVGVDSSDETHGDRVIAAAVAVQAMKSRPMEKVSGKGVDVTENLRINPPANTMAARELAHKRHREDMEDAEEDWTVSAMFGNGGKSDLVVMD